MARRRTPEERLHDAQQSMLAARRQLTRAVELQFDTAKVPPLADLAEAAEPAAQATESDA